MLAGKFRVSLIALRNLASSVDDISALRFFPKNLCISEYSAENTCIKTCTEPTFNVRSEYRCSQIVIAASEKFARRGIIDRILLPPPVDVGSNGLFKVGVTQKFEQIFFREDKDLTGKRFRDPKNAYVTGFFGNR
jgi:hypothetical protein